VAYESTESPSKAIGQEPKPRLAQRPRCTLSTARSPAVSIPELRLSSDNSRRSQTGQYLATILAANYISRSLYDGAKDVVGCDGVLRTHFSTLPRIPGHTSEQVDRTHVVSACLVFSAMPRHSRCRLPVATNVAHHAMPSAPQEPYRLRRRL
jgi:hypothetical protein